MLASPLGPTGLYWMKVQLANLYGYDKASFDGRAAFTDEHVEQIYDSARRPLEGDQWWARGENPWQVLAVCQDLVRALESGDPEAYCSSQPVHMDGSCNGLQHYAALGRDAAGGEQVNLSPGEKPGDVYSGVCAIVVAKVAQEAAKTLPEDATEAQIKENLNAKLVDGLIDRKVVKQTVMTSVYGVTFIGARKQIQARLEEKLAETDMDPDDIEGAAYGAGHYVARITMDALTELFTGKQAESFNGLF